MFWFIQHHKRLPNIISLITYFTSQTNLSSKKDYMTVASEPLLSFTITSTSWLLFYWLLTLPISSQKHFLYQPFWSCFSCLQLARFIYVDDIKKLRKITSKSQYDQFHKLSWCKQFSFLMSQTGMRDKNLQIVLTLLSHCPLKCSHVIKKTW